MTVIFLSHFIAFKVRASQQNLSKISVSIYWDQICISAFVKGDYFYLLHLLQMQHFHFQSTKPELQIITSVTIIAQNAPISELRRSSRGICVSLRTRKAADGNGGVFMCRLQRRGFKTGQRPRICQICQEARPKLGMLNVTRLNFRHDTAKETYNSIDRGPGCYPLCQTSWFWSSIISLKVLRNIFATKKKFWSNATLALFLLNMVKWLVKILKVSTMSNFAYLAIFLRMS